MRILNKEYLKKDELKSFLTDLYYFNEDDLLSAQLHGCYKEEAFHSGFLCAIKILNSFYNLNLEKDIDNYDYFC